jgi:hypothetical protein
MLTEDGYNNIKNRLKIIKQLLLSTEVLSVVHELTFFTNLRIIILVRYSVIIINQQYRVYSAYRQNIAHLRQEFHNSKFGIFELMV